MAEGEPQYSYEAYAEYHVIKQDILQKYFECQKALVRYRNSISSKRNTARRLREFTDAIVALYLPFRAKIYRFKDEKGKDFSDLSIIKDFIVDSKKVMTNEQVFKFFFRVQDLITATGIDQIEKKKLKPGEAWREIEEDD